MSRRTMLIIGGCLIALTAFQCAESGGERRSSVRPSGQQRRLSPEELERRALELNALQAENEALNRTLRAKEMQLFEKQAELDSIKTALEQKELELLQREKAAKSTRNTGVFFLLAGLALIFLALRKMVRGKEKAAPKPTTTKSADAPKSEPKQDAEASKPAEN